MLAAVCTYILVKSGDSCASLATRCGITAANFTKYNPSSTLCSTLAIGQPVCCSAGSLPNLTPQKNPDGTCASYTVKSGDYCALVAQNNYITVDNIESYNAKTWGWNGCSNLQLGAKICLSTGDPPMPAAVAGTVCGPQVSGTKRPSNWSDIGSLNPCPLNACCDVWGQCGITPDFCTPTKSSTGAPGTSAPGTNGCISNCGTSIINSDKPPTEFRSIGYFESFGANRSCLAMDASQIPSSYSHVHYAFGSITSGFQVDLSENLSQFEIFANSTGFKRILSFGGWSFSTSADSAPIFRQGVTDANRKTFAQSVVNTINKYNLDGVDFDWEYPGAPDIPGVNSSPSDGPNYLSFLQNVRSILPTGKSLSIAAPASFWYLKGFPIANMSQVLDYIVYMTYDLHGQWDYNSTFANPGCPKGNCLRSHVNLTETEYALSMITKAGVPTNKIAVGIAGYGRSFGMVNPSCTGPQCLFTGPDSTATPGECTNTAGYISQAELEALSGSSLARRAGVTSWHDDSSDSDIMTYGNNTWVAYMSQDTKASRINRYAALNFAGSVEWAIDLVQFVESPEDVDNAQNVTALEENFTAALALSNYDVSQFEDYNLTLLSTVLKGWDRCEKKYGFDPEQITSGWQQSWKIINLIYKEANSGINWNEASAVEYLGPPAQNKAYQAAMTEIFKNLPITQPGWFGDWNPLSWRIAVRCDDPTNQCPCGLDSKTVAYTLNKDPNYNIPSINFCARYFTQQTLDQVIRAHANPVLEVTEYANMSNYNRNQGSTWVHELMHIDFVAKAEEYGDIEHITDIKMKFKIGKDEEGNDKFFGAKAYGPYMVKALARFAPPDNPNTGLPEGTYTIRNADNLSLYTLARYVQKALKNVYPHLPLAPAPPAEAFPSFRADGYFTFYSNGTAELPADQTLIDQVEWDLSQGVCAETDDIDGGERPDSFATLTSFSQVLKPTDFPADYLSSWSSWAGLTPSTTSAAPSPTATWIIAIYSQPNCVGDYYSLEGHNLDSTTNQCLVLRGGNLPNASTTGTSCRWFTNGGNTWNDCSKSTLTQPLSWVVLGGSCTAYDTNTCTDTGNADAYDASQGCHNYAASDFDTKTWVSLQCGAQPDIGELRERPLRIVNSTIVVNGTKSSKGQYTTVLTKAVDPNLHKSYRFPRPTPTR